MNSQRPILVTGASSFLGAHFVRYLGRHAPEVPVVAVVNRTPLTLRSEAPSEVLHLDLTSPEAEDLVAERGPRAIVHLACKVMTRDGPATNLAMLEPLLAAARRVDASFVHASTTQVGWSKKNAYALGRIEEERVIEASGIPYVILRPCAPYGPRLPDHVPHHPESFHRLADLVRRSIAVPVPGTGLVKRQPVHATDWSEILAHFALREAVSLPCTAYDVGGPEPLSFLRIVDLLALALGRKVYPVPVPLQALQAASHVVPGLDPDQIRTSDCEDTVELAPLIAETGKDTWIHFEDGARDLLGATWSHWGHRTGILGRVRR